MKLMVVTTRVFSRNDIRNIMFEPEIYLWNKGCKPHCCGSQSALRIRVYKTFCIGFQGQQSDGRNVNKVKITIKAIDLYQKGVF